jgi:hypothetical protein
MQSNLYNWVNICTFLSLCVYIQDEWDTTDSVKNSREYYRIIIWSLNFFVKINLGAFALPRKTPISLVISFSISVCPHLSVTLPMKLLRWNLILGLSSRLVKLPHVWLKKDKNVCECTLNPQVRCHRHELNKIYVSVTHNIFILLTVTCISKIHAENFVAFRPQQWLKEHATMFHST